MFTRHCWQVQPGIAQQMLGLQSLDACFALQGQRVTKDPKSLVTLHSDPAGSFYAKRYTRSGKYLRKYLGRSRVRAEWENLQLFAGWGIATPPLLAFGEERQGLRFVKGALVTSTIAGARDLETLHRQNSPWLREWRLFRQVAVQVAHYTRAIHQHGFAHNDLDWRNILVVADDENTHTAPAVYFFDCPGGRFWKWPFLEYRVMKDLAHLDKIAREILPLRWRLWFYHCYTGRQRLSPHDRRRLQRIARYYDGRD